MKSFTLVTAFLFVCIVAISQVWAAPAEPMEEAEGIAHTVRTEEPQATPEACASTMNVEQAHHNLMMAVCEQMQPGFIHNMMETGDRHMMQHLDRRDTDSEAYTAQFFPPFPPFPPPPTFPPFPPFPPSGRPRSEAQSAQFFPPFPPFPPPPTFPPFPPFPPGTGGGRGGRGRQ